jgi:hypothetical protein
MGITSSDGLSEIAAGSLRESAAKQNRKCYGLRGQKSTQGEFGSQGEFGLPPNSIWNPHPSCNLVKWPEMNKYETALFVSFLAAYFPAVGLFPLYAVQSK